MQSLRLSQSASVESSPQVSALDATHTLRAESQLKPRAQSLSCVHGVTVGLPALPAEFVIPPVSPVFPVPPDSFPVLLTPPEALRPPLAAPPLSSFRGP